MSTKDCADVRRAIEARQFVGWTGLPAGCKGPELFASIPDDLADRPTRPLGDEARPTVFVLLDLPGYYRPMANFHGSKPVLFDGMNPELADGVMPLRADLGEPAGRFDWYYGTLKIPAGEWIYPARGITLFLNTAGDKALHIALYRPTTLKNYQKTLRPPLRKTLSPQGPVL